MCVGGGGAPFFLEPQGLWLNFAYQLEFLGHDTFWLLWLSSLAFFLAHIAMLAYAVTQYAGGPVFSAGKITRLQRAAQVKVE